jgi:TonB family protein
MKALGLSLFFLGLLSGSPGSAQAQTEAPSQKLAQSAALKVLKSPPIEYPDEAVLKHIEGTVVMEIVVDSSGKVSDAKALSGPPELFKAALDNVKQSQFEPPAHAPVTTKWQISYGFPKPCPAATADMGVVIGNGRLLDKNGKVVGTEDYDKDELQPYYFEEDRKARIAGEMVLSLSFDNQDKLKEIHVVKSLSAHLDEQALETVRTWTFHLKNAGLGDARKDLRLKFTYEGYCSPFVNQTPVDDLF